MGYSQEARKQTEAEFKAKFRDSQETRKRR